MRQVLQSLGNGETRLAGVPCPAARDGSMLIRSRATLISAGTERMLLDFGKAGWIQESPSTTRCIRMVLDAN